jgi:hypothetical protein
MLTAIFLHPHWPPYRFLFVSWTRQYFHCIAIISSEYPNLEPKITTLSCIQGDCQFNFFQVGRNNQKIAIFTPILGA